MNAIVPAEQKGAPLDKFRLQFESRRVEIAGSLPAHIPYERYQRVIMNAVAQNVDLLMADRASLLIAVAKSAADGLLCDGREAALVIFNTKKKDDEGRERWVNAVQYMPMVAGILKKVRNSGELSSIVARVVYAGDKFRNWIDDTGEHIEYEAGDEQDRDIVRCAFAMAKLKDGSIEVEVLRPADIEKIRSVSRAKDNGPWKTWWEEMAKKSAIRRLSKRLPLNTDLDDLIRQDDALYDLNSASDKVRRPQQPALTIDQKIAALTVDETPHDPETGEIRDQTITTSDAGDPPQAASEPAGRDADRPAGSGAEPAANGSAPSNDKPAAAEGEAKKPKQADAKPAKAPEAKPDLRKEPKVGDDPKRDEATRADLLTEATRRSADSAQALFEFENDMTEYEADLLQEQIGDLRRAARLAEKEKKS